VEQLAALRATPNLTVFRPADSRETSAAWSYALRSAKTPTAIVLTRQKTRLLKETGKDALKGGYILRDTENPNIILMASGSEVELIYDAFDILLEKGLKPRAVSMPSMEIFDAQPARYRESVLPKEIERRIAVEAASPMCWYKYTGLCGIVIGMETFGASAPAESLFQKFGFTTDNIVQKALAMKKC
jgi:transketolase